MANRSANLESVIVKDTEAEYVQTNWIQAQLAMEVDVKVASELVACDSNSDDFQISKNYSTTFLKKESEHKPPFLQDFDYTNCGCGTSTRIGILRE